MPTTYKVRIRKTEKRQGVRATTYRVRWTVDGQEWKETYPNTAQADSFRSKLVTAARQGEAFDIDTGRPVSMSRVRSDISWYEFACTYVDVKWATAAGKYRKSIAEALMTVTFAMFATERGRPDEKVLRLALRGWAFNRKKRASGGRPGDIAAALQWVERNTLPVSAFADPDKMRHTLDLMAQRLDGQPAAPNTAKRKRAVLTNALSYAVGKGYLPTNPMEGGTWAAPKAAVAVDRRCVVNPVQARTLLNFVREQQRSGPHLAAFFAVLYFAGLRPEEAADLRVHNLRLPAAGWGEATLEGATPDAGKDWTDSGEQRDDRRQLKHRARGDVRTVPLVPELVTILRHHVAAYGADPEGRLFRAANGGALRTNTYTAVWKRARAAAFTPEAARSPLGRRPYDLRHACVSTWLNGGVPATQVAEWAGHSVQVLLRVYAKCLDGQQHLARMRIEEALRG